MNKYTFDDYYNMVNGCIDKYVPVCNFSEDIVHEAMKYSLSIGGKRIRPMLVLEFCRVCGGDVESAVPFAVALEMIHTYSLIHDDLPCMDDDDIRRGKPSCHIKYGEAFALLAGDGLLTRAFGIIAESEIAEKRPDIAVKAIKALSELSGVNGMIGGQVVDLVNENRSAPIEVLEVLDSLKTGALIRCAAYLGAICADADEEKINAAQLYAGNLGYAFQIVDDILDVVGDENLLGKPIGSDAESGKSTYVSLLGLEKAREAADKLTDDAVRALEKFGNEADFLKNLAYSLAKRKH
ncbi:MAG: polyprenyl synthetase family protein [Clostridia bacterium]|nr:polyprenyl synthetase family protein [Clostridia bacterium]